MSLPNNDKIYNKYPFLVDIRNHNKGYINWCFEDSDHKISKIGGTYVAFHDYYLEMIINSLEFFLEHHGYDQYPYEEHNYSGIMESLQEVLEHRKYIKDQESAESLQRFI